MTESPFNRNSNHRPDQRKPLPHGHWREGFGRRLATYLMGIAIGLMILGMFQRMKANAQRSQDAAAQAAQNDESPAPAPDAAPGLSADGPPSDQPGG